MDPLITNGIDPALWRVLEKPGNERDPLSRRKRPAVPEKPVEEEESKEEPGPETPKHTLDDLA
ncbi:MAG: hypothetical protein ABR920_07365 [Terriglobales bacterium]|jgi:hypothetical protein